MSQTMAFEEKTVFEEGSPHRRGVRFQNSNDSKLEDMFALDLIRKEKAEMPELSETDVTRHFTRLSLTNFSKDLGFYPLGSCTMKHNPKVANDTANIAAFRDSHPYQPVDHSQGNLELMWELQNDLAEISGMDEVSLLPAAGAHGELSSMLMIRAYHKKQGNPRKKVLIPDSAHGTNPASAALCHYDVVELKSDADGLLNPATVREAMDEDVAAIMITNPNTLGIFEEHFQEVAEIVHEKGGLVYCDGANLNALMGIVKLGKIGADIMHFNLHKTFGTPHGGGGPGSGPIGVVKKLEPFLPTPRIVKDGDKFEIKSDFPDTIGRVKSFLGHFAIYVRAYTYIRQLGADGLKRATQMAVLNANYIKSRLKNTYHIPYSKESMHECVFSDQVQNKFDVKTLDIAKRLMDYGFHPPTIYFPLIVHGALMIEPTETEAKYLIDQFCSAMITIAKECEEKPELVKGAPYTTYRGRLDEAMAARKPKLKFTD
ncbi:MAG: aminomethyl-transferring glycine dehydrogenase subunit GcvPB [Pseudomonadota bacterium]